MKEFASQWIRPLPERVINKIAAGEVIERPAAVVKELTENSIDAGAARIDIMIEKSGTRLIKIVDNGCGISEEQVEIAFSRHATSKIRNFEDLSSLYSYGFRGEALPSVASISRLRMVTRTADAEVGTEIIYEGGILQSRRPLASPPGTTVEVEDLFYNTPARRKFLKAETTEARHVSRTAMALAIGRCDIGFSYTLNSRRIFSAAPDSSLKDRIAQITGLGNKLIKVDGKTGPVEVTGFIGTPDTVQNSRYGQFVFINGRYVYSPSLAHALVAGYGDLIPRGTYPVGALLLTVDASEIDVNVHPTKAEVRLSREREVHDAVFRIVGQSLQQEGIIPRLKTSVSGESKDANGGGSGTPPEGHGSAYIPGIHQTPPGRTDLMAELNRAGRPGGRSVPADVLRVDGRTGEVMGSEDRPQTGETYGAAEHEYHLIGRFSNLYLILQAGEDLYIVDQHTAHERVLYEETLSKLEDSSVEGQVLLFPSQVELNPEQLALFDEQGDLLNSSGFSISSFGGRMVKIEAVPSVLSGKSPEAALRTILDDLLSEKKAGHDMRKAMAQSIACRSAVMSGDKLSDPEALHLIDRLLRCENKYSCPHGRPTFVKISRQDLDKQFGRT